MDYDFKKHDVPVSFRVPHKEHRRYKELSGFAKKTIQYKFNLWFARELKKVEE